METLYKTNLAEGVGGQVHQRELQTSSVLEFLNDLCEVYCVEPGKICQLKVNKIKNLKPNKAVQFYYKKVQSV